MENIKLKDIINRKFINKYLIIIFSFSLFIGLMEMSIFYMMYSNILDNYNKTIKYIIKTDGKDPTIICNALQCEKISYNAVVFEKDDGYLKMKIHDKMPEAKYFGIFTKDFKTLIKYFNDDVRIRVLTDDRLYLINMLITMFTNIVIFILLFSFIYLKISIRDFKTNILEKKSFRLELEGKLQRTMAESASHEMTLPLAVIKTMFNDFMRELYPCNYSPNGICTFENRDKPECKNCPIKYQNRKTDVTRIQYYTRINLAIERLEAVLNQISKIKSAKSEMKNLSIYEMINEAAIPVNGFLVNKLNIKYENMDIMRKYTNDDKLSNGDLLNILDNCINNSNDAKAKTVKFKAVMKNKKTMYLYIGDDGIGIRDEYNNIVATDKIFESGFTTKDKNGEQVIKKKTNFFMSIYNKIFHIEDEKDKAIRGVGLYLNKNLLKESGGDLVLIETSERGTTFRLTIPVKELK